MRENAGAGILNPPRLSSGRFQPHLPPESEIQMSSLATRLHTFFNGTLVGTDEEGNRYYKERRAKPMVGSSLKERRWVIYRNEKEASRVPPEWQGWMNHTLEQAPTEASLSKFAWQKEHQPNQTGTPGAYIPDGDPRTAQPRAATTGDYQAWNPNEAG
jgi:NADH:ubiquinone oxidoreductase subunit